MTREALQTALQAAFDAEDVIQLETLAQEAVENYPNAAFGYYFLGEALIRIDSNQYGAIETCLVKALELEPQNTAYLLRLAQLKEVQGQHSMAQVIWDRLLEVQPKHPDGLLGKAMFALQFYQNYSESIRLLTILLEQDAQHILALTARAEAYSQTETYELALQDLDQVLMQGFNEGALIMKISVHQALRQPQKTLELYQALLAEFPEQFNHLFSYGKTLFDVQEYTKAADQLIKAQTYLETEDVLFYNILGDATLADQRYEIAVNAFEKCIALGTNSGEIYLQLFKALVASEQYDKISEVENNIQTFIAKNDNLAQRFLIEQAKYYVQQNAFEKAESILIPLAQEKTLRQPDAYYYLGMIYHRQNDLPKAYKFLKAAQVNRQQEAQQYIQQHFKTFLKDLQQKALSFNQAAIAKNKQSPFLQQLFGKVWCFKDLDSQQLQAFPEKGANNIKESLQHFSIVFSDQGALFISDKGADSFTYRIKKQAKNGVLIEMLPLDNTPLFLIKIERMDEGIALSRQKGERMLLQAVDFASIEAATRHYFQGLLELDDLTFLGNTTVEHFKSIL